MLSCPVVSLCMFHWIIFKIVCRGSTTILWCYTLVSPHLYLFSSSATLLEPGNNDQKWLEPPAYITTWRWHWGMKDLQSSHASTITTILHQRFMEFGLLLFFTFSRYHALSLHDGWSLSKVLSSLISVYQLNISVIICIKPLRSDLRRNKCPLWWYIYIKYYNKCLSRKHYMLPLLLHSSGCLGTAILYIKVPDL